MLASYHANLQLANYASKPEESMGRRHREDCSYFTSPYEEDRIRITCSSAFRRLKEKTQVFVNPECDFYRTRLTHTIEVSQNARLISRKLGLNEDLAEAIALAHDIGHPPFGHAGEKGLNQAKANWGGFHHHVQAMRVVESERCSEKFDGLNLSWETLEGIIKGNGPVLLQDSLNIDSIHLPFSKSEWPSAEAQVAAIADDLTYNHHDVEDGIRAGLFSMEDLEEMPLFGEAIGNLTKVFRRDNGRFVKSMLRNSTFETINDIVLSSQENLKMLSSVESVRQFGRPVIAMSLGMFKKHMVLKDFLMSKMYLSNSIRIAEKKYSAATASLFHFFFNDYECLPDKYRNRIMEANNSIHKASIVADYVSGMTDRYAINKMREIFDF